MKRESRGGVKEGVERKDLEGVGGRNLSPGEMIAREKIAISSRDLSISGDEHFFSGALFTST